MPKTKFSQNFSALVAQRGAKAAVTKATGLHETTIFKYASGDAEPKASNLAIVADALGVTPNDLLGYDPALNRQLLKDAFTQVQTTALELRLKLSAEDTADIAIRIYESAMRKSADQIESDNIIDLLEVAARHTASSK